MRSKKQRPVLEIETMIRLKIRRKKQRPVLEIETMTVL